MIDVEGTPEMADSMLRYLERVATLPPAKERIRGSA
jgi:hypothetical protein